MTRIHLLAFILLMGTACGIESPGVNPPADRLHYPISIASHPDGRYLYVANAGFDRNYAQGTLSVYDAQEGRFLAEATTPIGLFGGEIILVKRGGVVLGTTTSREKDHLIQFVVDADQGDSAGHITILGTTDEFGVGQFAADPYAVASAPDGVMIGHLAQGVISRWGYSGEQSEGSGLDYRCSLTLPGGVSHVARHPGNGWWYITDFAGPNVYVVEELELPASLRTADRNCELVVRASILANPYTSRGLSFNRDGSLLFVVSSGDDSLKVFDTSIGYLGQPRNRLIRAVPIGKDPAVVKVAPDEGGQGLIYITLYGDERLIVLNPETFAVVARIRVGSTPHDLAFAKGADGLMRAYLTNFDDASLSVVIIDPDSPVRFSLETIER